MVLPGPEGGAFRGAVGETRWHREAAASWFFADCPADVAAWAASQLRGQFWTIGQEVSPMKAWPSVPTSYVLGKNDPVINPDWSRRISRCVLGVEPIELDAGHSPFLSTPAALARALANST